MENDKQKPAIKVEPKLYEVQKEDMQNIRKQALDKQKTVAHIVTGDVIVSDNDL